MPELGIFILGLIVCVVTGSGAYCIGLQEDAAREEVRREGLNALEGTSAPQRNSGSSKEVG